MAELISAAENNDLDTLRRLLDAEIAQNAETFEQRRGPKATGAMLEASYTAARRNHQAALNMLLDSGCPIMHDTIWAAIDGEDTNTFQCLLDHGWDINSNVGHTGDALILAISCRNLDLVHFLLSHGADPNANTRIRRGALEVATFRAPIPMIEALLDAGAHLKGRIALQIAAREGRLDVIALLLERGADIDEVPKNADLDILDYNEGIKNALCEAAWRGQTVVMEMLLERGADMYIKDTNGRLAVELAEMGGHETCVEILNRHARLSCK